MICDSRLKIGPALFFTIIQLCNIFLYHHKYLRRERSRHMSDIALNQEVE